jgi:hypothetical protein|nr:hypothetical protein [Neorhizobium tomejilense]
MLFVDTEEALKTSGDKPYADFYAKVMTGIVSRLPEAEVFVLDPTASAMAVSVFLSRPSSIVQALQFVRLPAPKVWIEYSNIAVRDAFAKAGNENTWIEGSVFIERTGLLLTQRDELIEMEAIAQFKREDNSRVIELLSAKCAFDTSASTARNLSHAGPRKIDHEATGQAKRYYDLLSRDEKESAANADLRTRFSSELHPDYEAVIPQVGMAHMAKMMAGHANDIYRMFTTQILPGLILINCRNAVEQEAIPAPLKLNKARRAKGRTEIGPYKLIKLKLRDKVQRRYEEYGGTKRQIAGGLVIGHFKVRKTGVYWWSPFVRQPGVVKDYRTVRMVIR